MKSKHLPLVIGIALPIVFIAVTAIVVFLPSITIKPKYNFIYTAEANNYTYGEGYRNSYKIENGKIVIDPIPKNRAILSSNLGVPVPSTYDNKKDAPNIYMYDIKTDSSQEISFGDVENLSLDPGPSSPDGYNIVYNSGSYGGGVFGLFGSGHSSESGFFITKGSGKKKLSDILDKNYGYIVGFKFIGWVK